MSRFLHGKSVEEVSKPLNLAIALAMIGIPAVFVVLQPNLGTTLIIVMDGCSLLFLAGPVLVLDRAGARQRGGGGAAGLALCAA